MQFGNISGLVGSVEQVVFDYTVTGSPVASIATGTVLNGDEDEVYTVFVRTVRDAADMGITFAVNGVSAFGRASTSANNVTIGYSSATSIIFGVVDSSNPLACSYITIHAKTGTDRVFRGMWAERISGTTVTEVASHDVFWSDTATNITSMTFTPTVGNIGVGTRIIIVKGNAFTNGTTTGIITTPYIEGGWYRVGSSVLGAPATSVVFSGLDGDRDVMYYLACNAFNNSATNIRLRTYFNGDTTAANYGSQLGYGEAAAANAFRETSSDGNRITVNSTATNNYCSASTYIFATTGFNRTIMSKAMSNVNGTSVQDNSFGGHVWNNSGSNITSLTVHTGTIGTYGIGSQFQLYALRPAG